MCRIGTRVIEEPLHGHFNTNYFSFISQPHTRLSELLRVTVNGPNEGRTLGYNPQANIARLSQILAGSDRSR